jgi:hypothetical protein
MAGRGARGFDGGLRLRHTSGGARPGLEALSPEDFVNASEREIRSSTRA